MISDKSYDLYKAIREGNKPRVMKHWHASQIAQCPRAHYFARLGVEPLEVPNAGKLLRWEAGHHLETALRPRIAKVWGKTTTNKRLTSKELDFTGEYDNLTVEDNVLIEDKSVHNYAFKEKDGQIGLKVQIGTLPNGNKQWGITQSPYLNHELQNHGYVILLKEKDIEVKRIDYVYASLDGRIVTYKTEVQQKLIDNVLKRLEVLNEAWKNQEPPKCICQPNHPLWDSTMQFCDYRTEESCCELTLVKEKV